MLIAIAPSPLIRTATPHPAGLENQLARYRQQLSDCVNCPATSKTPEGQERARVLSDKIGEIKSRLETASSTGAQAESERTTAAAQGALGNHLNIYA